MHIDILTIFPEMFEGPFKHSIIKRAKEKNLVNIQLINIRDFTTNKHKYIKEVVVVVGPVEKGDFWIRYEQRT